MLQSALSRRYAGWLSERVCQDTGEGMGRMVRGCPMAAYAGGLLSAKPSQPPTSRPAAPAAQPSLSVPTR